MELKRLMDKLTVCKVMDISGIDLTADFYFIGKTDEELSLVCKTNDVPPKTIERDDGWRGFRIRVKNGEKKIFLMPQHRKWTVRLQQPVTWQSRTIKLLPLLQHPAQQSFTDSLFWQRMYRFI